MKIRTLTRNPSFPLQYGELNPLSASQMDDFERSLAADEMLPAAYRDFLFRYNGGIFNECIVPHSKQGTLIASFFLHISSSDENSINRALPYFKNEVGRGMLPIASDPGGNYFLLCCRHDNFDGVFFWMHDRCDEDGNRIIKVSDHFSDFLNSLEIDD